MPEAACLVGDYYHEAAKLQPWLAPLLSAAGQEAAFYTDPDRFPWDSLATLSLVVLFKEGRAAPQTSNELWCRPGHETALAAYVRQGGRLLVLHSGLATYPVDGPLAAVVRGRFLFHPDEHVGFEVRERVPGALGMPGFRPFVITDEMYFCRIDSAATEVVLESVSPDCGSSAAAWRHREGQGRVFCLTPGHTDAVRAAPAYQAVIHTGLSWLLS